MPGKTSSAGLLQAFCRYGNGSRWRLMPVADSEQLNLQAHRAFIADETSFAVNAILGGGECNCWKGKMQFLEGGNETH